MSILFSSLKRNFESANQFANFLRFSNERDCPINLSVFRAACDKFAFFSAKDGNDYAVIEVLQNEVYAVVLTNKTFDDIDMNMGDIVVFQKFDTVKQAIQCVFNTVIQDNNLDDEE